MLGPMMDFAAIGKTGGAATGRLLEPDGERGWAPVRRWGMGVEAVVAERARGGGTVSRAAEQ